MLSVRFGWYILIVQKFDTEIIINLKSEQDSSIEHHEVYKIPISFEVLKEEFIKKGIPAYSSEWLTLRAKEMVSDLTK